MTKAAICGGLICVLLNVVSPELGFHGLPAEVGSVRLLAPLTLLIAAIFYAGLVDDSSRQSRRLHLISAGMVGGIACAFVLHALRFAVPLNLPVVALSAVIGAVLAVAGVFGFMARGL